MKIFLVRHGLKEQTAGDPPLSPEGKIQAHNTGLHLKRYDIQKVLASPLLRTRQTAELICHEIGLTYNVDENLRERMNWGDKPGQPFEKFIEEWGKTTLDRDFIPSAGDSSREAGLRLEGVIKQQVRSNSTANIALITHGGIIIDFLRNVFSEEDLNNAYDKFFQNMESVIKECSVTVVTYANGKFLLESLATIDHLTLTKTI